MSAPRSVTPETFPTVSAGAASAEEIRKSVESQAGAAETLERTLKHLEANGVDLAATPLTLGPQLQFDPKTEQVLGNDAAAKLMTREYRAPFVVPAIAG